MSLRDTILAASDRKVVPVEVREWGVTVFVRSLSLGASMAVLDAKDSAERAVRLLVHGACDADGKAIFSEADAAALLEKDGRVCGIVLEQIHKLRDSGGLAAAGEGSGATAG